MGDFMEDLENVKNINNDMINEVIEIVDEAMNKSGW